MPGDLTNIALALGEPIGGRVLDGDARVGPVTVPGMSDGAVWAVTDEPGGHPIRLYIGQFPDESARVLTADQSAWDDLVAAVGVHLHSPEQARAYVESYLEITRGAMVIVRAVTSLDQLPWRPGSDGEEAAKTALLASPPLLTATAASAGDGFHVELTLVVDQRLQRNTFDVSPGGSIQSSYRVLAEGLPLPIAW
jgi:hypothetical protein